MNGVISDVSESMAIATAANGKSAEIVICPPATLVDRAASVAKGSTLRIGGQDCHAALSGAHTGDVSAEMLADAGATYVIVKASDFVSILTAAV